MQNQLWLDLADENKINRLQIYDSLPAEEKLQISMGMDAAIGHHERWDGKGYPNHETGSNTPILGRMCAICNAYDKQTSTRLYSVGMPHEFACGEIIRESGFAFDPELVRAFKAAMPRFHQAMLYRREAGTAFE